MTKLTKAPRWQFEVMQDGQCVASGDGPSHSTVAAECAHYAMMYGQDGPVQAVIWSGRKPKLAALSTTTEAGK